MIVILGGPIGATDTDRYPWLASETAGVRRRLLLGRPTLGICLGAQLMAVAVGGSVTRRRDASGAPALEIGWSALALDGEAGPLEALREVAVLHWHGDNIVLPEGVASLASTQATPCQAFQVGRYALALQFHAEFSGVALEQWLTGHAVELANGGVHLQRLRGDTARFSEAMTNAGVAVLRSWLLAIHSPSEPVGMR